VAFRAKVDRTRLSAHWFREATPDLTEAERAYVARWLPPWAQEQLRGDDAEVA
jgi:hypothetical protein